ncbi:ATP-binding cassette sub- C member 8 [Geranomyces michiganensis]|nr:ATP-binding cassette sub- C member 8 [Geranomyces michiganensis]
MAQEAVLFSGTVRENLDPYGLYEDASMWAALDQCGMRTYFETRGHGLDEPIEAYGANLSVGMRQLLAAARVLLAKPKILIVDEATAAMDPQSDQTLRNVIDTCFPSTTILSIAHRLEFLVRMDRIVVLAEGHIVCSGSPRSMLTDPTSEFYKLAAAGGQASGGDGEAAVRKLLEMI